MFLQIPLQEFKKPCSADVLNYLMVKVSGISNDILDPTNNISLKIFVCVQQKDG